MRLILPLPLRRFLLGRLLFSVTIATAASGAEFVVDAAQATNPGQHVYNTLQELADSGALSSGDTVILHNDDSSLTSGLTVASISGPMIRILPAPSIWQNWGEGIVYIDSTSIPLGPTLLEIPICQEFLT